MYVNSAFGICIRENIMEKLESVVSFYPQWVCNSSKFVSKFLRLAKMQVHSGLQKGTRNFNPFPNKYNLFETAKVCRQQFQI